MSFTFSKIKVPMLIVNTCFQYPTSALHTPNKGKGFRSRFFDSTSKDHLLK